MAESAYIMKGDYRYISSSNAEKIKQIHEDFTTAVSANRADHERGLAIWKAYFAISGQQYPTKELQQLSEEDRYPYQFNFLTPKTQTYAGAIISDMPDINWVPVEGQKSTGTEAIRHSYYADKEQCNWMFALIKLVEAGLVHNGWVEMVESKKHSPLGNIGLEFVPFGRLIPDPYWKTDNDRDMKQCWKSVYMSPEQIKWKYKVNNEQLDARIREQQRLGLQKPPHNGAETRNRFEETVGQEFQVIENSWLEMVRKKRLVGVKYTDIGPQVIPFPPTDDREIIQNYAAFNGIDMMDIIDKPIPYEDVVAHKTAICPSISNEMILYDGKCRVQVKGLPYFHYSYQRYNSRNKGLAETIYDLQHNINKRMMTETELIEKANGGATLYNQNMFDNDAKQKKFQQNRNKPGYTDFVDLDGIKQTHIEIGPNQFPNQLNNQIQLIMSNFLGLISGVSDAMSSESASEDSGILYERKLQMNKISMTLTDRIIKQLMNNIGEAYFYQWKITYAGFQREINYSGAKEPIYLNQLLDDGRMMNAVEFVPRCRVIIVDNENSPTYKLAHRGSINDLLKVINPETNPLSYQNMILRTVEMTPAFNDEQKAEFKAGAELEKMAAQSRLKAEIAQNSAAVSGAAVQDAQAQNVLNQSGAGQPNQPEVEGVEIQEPQPQVQAAPPPQENQLEEQMEGTGELGI